MEVEASQVAQPVEPEAVAQEAKTPSEVQEPQILAAVEVALTDQTHLITMAALAGPESLSFVIPTPQRNLPQ